MEYMESKMQDMIEGGIADQSARDERDAIVAFLKSGGERVRGVWYSWDREMAGYANSFAEQIEAGNHHRE